MDQTHLSVRQARSRNERVLILTALIQHYRAELRKIADADAQATAAGGTGPDAACAYEAAAAATAAATAYGTAAAIVLLGGTVDPGLVARLTAEVRRRAKLPGRLAEVIAADLLGAVDAGLL